MNKQSTYLHFIRVSIFLALLGLSLDNIVSYAFIDLANAEFELFDPFDTEGEEENESKTEKDENKEDEKVQVNSFNFDTKSSHTLLNILLAKSMLSIPHRDIQTPPPKVS